MTNRTEWPKLSDDKKVADAEDRLKDLQSQLATIEGRIRELNQQTGLTPEAARQKLDKTPRADVDTEAAAAELAGVAVAVASDDNEILEDLIELGSQRRILNRAVELATKALADARREAMPKIGKALVKLHRTEVGPRLAKALDEFLAAAVEECDLVDHMQANGGGMSTCEVARDDKTVAGRILCELGIDTRAWIARLQPRLNAAKSYVGK